MKLNIQKKVVPAGVTISSPMFAKIPRPSFSDTLRFPDNVSELAASNISELHGKYTLLYAYANQELSENQVEVLRLKTEEERLTVIIANSNSDYLKTKEAWRRDLILMEYEKYREVKASLRKLHMERVSIEMFMKNFEMYISSLSRELSRKGMEESNYRGSKI